MDGMASCIHSIGTWRKRGLTIWHDARGKGSKKILESLKMNKVSGHPRTF